MNFLSVDQAGSAGTATVEMAASGVTENMLTLFGVALLFLLSAELLSRVLPRWQGRGQPDYGARLDRLHPRVGAAQDTAGSHVPADSAAPETAMIEAFAGASFETFAMLDEQDYPPLPVLENAVRQYGRGERVLTHVALPALIRPVAPAGATRDAAARALASMRLDYAIVDRSGRLIAALHLARANTRAPRENLVAGALKREAVRKAGAVWKDIDPRDSSHELEDWVRQLLRPGVAVTPTGCPPQNALLPVSRRRA